MAIDPVCGCEVVEVRPGNSAGYRGEMYVFCSQGCMDEFKRSPETYAGGRMAGGKQVAGGRETGAEPARATEGAEIPIRTPGRQEPSGVRMEEEGIGKRIEEKTSEEGHKAEKWWDRVVDWFKERV